MLNGLKKQRVLSQRGGNITHSQMKEYLYGRVNFRTENYIEEVERSVVKREQYDVILCLSTIKWVHLNYGDTGVKALFLKIKEQLAPGGLLIVEP